jgi:hypothetical protein
MDQSILINEIDAGNGCLKLDFKINPNKDCISFCDLCEISDLTAPDCDMSFWNNIHPCIKAESECEPCETSCLNYYQIEYCPDGCKIRLVKDRCCDPCRQQYAGRSALKSTYTVSINN